MKSIFTLLFVLSCAYVTAQIAPTVPAYNLSFSNIEGAGFQISFSKGNGSSRIVVLKEGSAVTGLPEDGKEYNANQNFGTTGTEFTGAGEYVVLKTTSATAVLVDKLKPGIVYYVAVFEYNGTGAAAKYLMVPLTGSRSTATAPTDQTKSVNFSEITGNSAKMAWTNGTGNGRLVLARKASAVNTEPADLKSYIPFTPGEFGTGNVINTDNYTIYKGAGTGVTVTRLEPNTTYHFAFFEYNGNATPVYLKPASTWSLTTNAGPTKPTQTITFSAIEGNRISVGCTVGNGSKRLLIASKSPVTAVPVNGTVYNANAVFGSGNEIAAGQFVVGNSSNQSVTVTNLEPNTTYYFRFFEFDEDAGNYTYYLTGSPLDGNKSTAAPPTGIATNFNAIVTGSSATVNFTQGTGNYRLVVLKEGSAVNAVPQDLTIYTGNGAFGSGTQVAPGNYSITGGSNGNSFNVNGLKAGYTYHTAIFEFNGTNYPVYNKTPATFSFSVPLEPTQASSSFVQHSKDGDRVRVGWTNGTGGKRIVVVRKGLAVTFKPADGASYVANSIFGQGTQVATGEYVAYDGSATYFDLTNLEIGATYYFAVYEYNVSDAGVPDYLTASYLTGNAVTITWPTQSTQALNATNIQSTQATINYSNGNGGGRIFVMHADMPVDAAPQDLTNYSGSSTTFGLVQFVSAGNYIVNKMTSAGSPFTVTNLAPNTTYYVKAFEYNGSGYPAYLVPGSGFSFTTTDVPGATVPTTASYNPAFSVVEGNKFTFTWANGDGANRIVVMRQGSVVNFTPANATAYTANDAYGTGADLGGQQYVVYNGSGNTVTVTNLLPATTYYFTVFEYNGSGSLLRYLTISTLTTSYATLSAPVTASSNVVASTTTNSMTLNWTNGSGSGRIVVVKKGSGVGASPADLSVYPANAAFQSGSQIAAGEYVVYAGSANTVLSGNSTITVTALAAGETYYYKIFEYNGSTGPVYNTTQTLSGFAATGTLPVTWIYFNATERNGKAVLTWATSAEINADHFIVERSLNGTDYHEAGRVKATGNSTGDQSYSFTDEVAGGSKLYYRLKQTDKDGKYSYSKIVSVQLTEEAMAVRLQPNPVQNAFRIQLPDNNQSASMVIYNAAGIIVRRQMVSNAQPVNVQELSAGMYYITLQQGDKRYALKMVKQ